MVVVDGTSPKGGFVFVPNSVDPLDSTKTCGVTGQLDRGIGHDPIVLYTP